MKKTYFLLILLLSYAFCREIVDFTLTEDLERSLRESSTNYNINILAQNIDHQEMTFPQACSMDKQLQIYEVIEYSTKNEVNNGQLLESLKTNMTVFLTLAEQLKNLRSQLQNLYLSLPQHSQKSEAILKNQQVQYLRQIEQSLQKMNSTIGEKKMLLEDFIVAEINRTTNSNALKKVRLNFQRAEYQARLKFLSDIKKKDISNPSQQQVKRKKKIEQYFEDLKFDNQNQDKQLLQLNILLQNYAIVSEIKLRLSNEMKKLQAKNITIENKLNCQRKVSKPIHKENHQNIQSIIENLKALKRKQSPNRQHCEGVATKLEFQLKKLLKIYNYSYLCQEGLPQLYKQKEQIEEKVKKLNEKLHNLDYLSNLRKIQSFYANNESTKQALISRISSFDINEYPLNSSILSSEIQSMKNKIYDIEMQINNPQESDAKPFDYEKIKEMLREINEQQAKYCQLKQSYQEEYNKIEDVVRRYENHGRSDQQLYRLYIEKVKSLKVLETEFDAIRQRMLLSIA